jgi:hypothetical protein
MCLETFAFTNTAQMPNVVSFPTLHHRQEKKGKKLFLSHAHGVNIKAKHEGKARKKLISK